MCILRINREKPREITLHIGPIHVPIGLFELGDCVDLEAVASGFHVDIIRLALAVLRKVSIAKDVLRMSHANTDEN